jgi:hypothetical protein
MITPTKGLPMKANVGSYDAGVRYLLGCAILFTTVNGAGWWGLLGLIPLVSAACNFCGIYWLFGINTEAWEECVEERRRNAIEPHRYRSRRDL